MDAIEPAFSSGLPAPDTGYCDFRNERKFFPLLFGRDGGPPPPNPFANEEGNIADVGVLSPNNSSGEISVTRSEGHSIIPFEDRSGSEGDTGIGVPTSSLLSLRFDFRRVKPSTIFD